MKLETPCLITTPVNKEAILSVHALILFLMMMPMMTMMMTTMMTMMMMMMMMTIGKDWREMTY